MGVRFGSWSKALSMGVAAASNCVMGRRPTISSMVRSMETVL
jgi:hypothetical protein